MGLPSLSRAKNIHLSVSPLGIAGKAQCQSPSMFKSFPELIQVTEPMEAHFPRFADQEIDL